MQRRERWSASTSTSDFVELVMMMDQSQALLRIVG
jgi:hypothetical protein